MDAQIVFSNNPDVIIILETACPRLDMLWSCNDNYTAHYLTSEKEDYESNLGSGVAVLAKKHIKIYILQNRISSNIIVA